jgi:serine/threonine protein kinase
MKCDVWTMGIIYYELLTGDIPACDKDDETRIKNIMKNGIIFPNKNNISNLSKEFIRNCL